MEDYADSPYTAGEAPTFMSWTPNSEITLCRVAWGSDYRDIVSFSSQSALDSYLDSKATSKFQYKRTTPVMPGQPIKVDLPLSVVYQYNYVRVRNYQQDGLYPAGENPGTVQDVPRTFYYFINDAQYHAPNSTQLMVQLDVWQTFSRYVTFGNCYCERGHIGIANSRQFNNQGRDYLTVPEGLDVGDEYWIKDQWIHMLASARGDVGVSDSSVLVASTIDFQNSGGTASAPVLQSASGSVAEHLPNGLALYLFNTQQDWTTFLLQRQGQPWVTSGVISATIVPANLFNLTASDTPITDSGITYHRLMDAWLPVQEITLKSNWRTAITPTGRYANLKKFMTFPYAMVELTTNSGNPLVLKPEAMQDNDLVVVQLSHLVPPDPRIAFYCRDYNKGNNAFFRSASTNEMLNDYGEFLDMLTGIFNLPQFSVVNDSYINYIAANKNTIAYQYQSADWSQQRAMQGNQLAYNQSGVGMDVAQGMMQGQNAAITQSTDLANQTLAYRSIQQGINGAVGGMMQGGPGGLVNGALGAANAAASYAIGSHQNNASAEIQRNLNEVRNNLTVGQMGYNRDTNKSYADWAAKGDYENEIRAINAKVRDARMIQPTTSGQIGGDAFNYAIYGWAVIAKPKTIDNATMRNIGEFWLRYGYAINAFITMPKSYMVMEKFTYWRLKETYITSAYCPEAFKATLRGIFEKGVTVWSDPSYIGNVDIANNRPLSGVSY